ncbi:MAG: DUF4832 domain-containing protein [candidate division KSB1 bacterium]|nr:DUF4832 domain-containing protein [candidate division KSB1 bacterium]
MRRPLCTLVLATQVIAVAVFNCSRKTPTGPDLEEVILEEIDDVLRNPFKGFVTWVGEENPVYPTTLQYRTYQWRDIEPEPGVFDWEEFERGWGDISVTGKRVGFRISACTPGSGNPYDIPDWLVEQGVGLRPYCIDGQAGLAPDWDDPRFLEAHRRLIRAIGARYDRDDRVAWVDIGSYGFWGEWCVWQNESLAASQATKQAILEVYFEAFPTKPKVIAFDDPFATQWVTSRGGGLRNDCLGTEEGNAWYLASLNRIDPGLNDRVWKQAFITGEFCGARWGAIMGTTGRFEVNYRFIQQTHWSFIGPSGGDIAPLTDEHRRNLDRLYKTLGYRFVLRRALLNRSVKRGGKLGLVMMVQNKGVAPFYFRWPLVVYLINSKGEVALQRETAIDIREWLPGTRLAHDEIAIPEELPPGRYEIRVAIHDPAKGKPGVLFANAGKDQEGRYPLGIVLVE